MARSICPQDSGCSASRDASCSPTWIAASTGTCVDPAVWYPKQPICWKHHGTAWKSGAWLILSPQLCAWGHKPFAEKTSEIGTKRGPKKRTRKRTQKSKRTRVQPLWLDPQSRRKSGPLFGPQKGAENSTTGVAINIANKNNCLYDVLVPEWLTYMEVV